VTSNNGGNHHGGGGGGGGGGGCSVLNNTGITNGISADIILLVLVPFIVIIRVMSRKFIKIFCPIP